MQFLLLLKYVYVPCLFFIFSYVSNNELRSFNQYSSQGPLLYQSTQLTPQNNFQPLRIVCMDVVWWCFQRRFHHGSGSWMSSHSMFDSLRRLENVRVGRWSRRDFVLAIWNVVDTVDSNAVTQSQLHAVKECIHPARTQQRPRAALISRIKSLDCIGMERFYILQRSEDESVHCSRARKLFPPNNR